MSLYTPGHSRILSTGSWLPESRISLEEILDEIDAPNRFGVNRNWLTRMTGIHEKRVTPRGILPSDMAVSAAHEALDYAGVLANDLDAIIFAGVTRDYIVEPSCAHVVQSKLGARNAAVFDVSNACHGFMNGIHVMDALIASGQVRRGLVVCGEQGSLFTNKALEALKTSHDKQLLMDLAAGLTLGDAGAALLMGPKLEPDTGFLGFMLTSEGESAEFCTCGGPLEDGPVYTDMPGIVSRSLPLMAGMYRIFMKQHIHWRTDQLKKYVAHQVGTTSFRHHTQNTGIPLGIIPKTVDTLGNLITATIPVILNHLQVGGEMASGDKVYLAGAGSGISVSQAGLVWDID